MAMSVGSGGGSLAEINVTPLVDVMLVLLIIFMVTAPMMDTGVDLKLPQAKAKILPDDSGKMVISITKNGDVLLDKMKLDPMKIEETLKQNARLQSEREAYLRADRDLKYGAVLKVMAAMQAAGVDKLGMITDPLE